jgi:hypothetical protein
VLAFFHAGTGFLLMRLLLLEKPAIAHVPYLSEPAAERFRCETETMLILR